MSRLPAIDLHRGLIVLLMVMHHTVDAWMTAADRKGALYNVLQALGGMPAPGFLFLAGLSAALVVRRQRWGGVPVEERVSGAVRRGLYVLGIGFVIRLFAYAAGGRWSDGWHMIFRVDILHCMGVSLSLLGALLALSSNGRQAILASVAMGLLFALAAPVVVGRTFDTPSIYLGNYIAGSGELVLFPLFPWLAYAAAGCVTGELLGIFAGQQAGDSPRIHIVVLLSGLVLIALGWGLARLPITLYPQHSYWLASPLYTAIRLGLAVTTLGLMGLLAWWRPGLTRTGHPLQVLGRHSLAIYWVHIEAVYGFVSGPMHGRLTVWQSLGAALLVNMACYPLALWLDRKASRRAAVVVCTTA